MFHVIDTTRFRVVSVRSLTIGSSPLAEKGNRNEARQWIVARQVSVLLSEARQDKIPLIFLCL